MGRRTTAATTTAQFRGREKEHESLHHPRRRRRQGKGKRRARHGRDERWREEEEEGRCPILWLLRGHRSDETERTTPSVSGQNSETIRGQGHREIQVARFQSGVRGTQRRSQ